MVVIVLAFESTFLNVVWFKKDSNTPKLNWNVTLQEARIYFTQFRFMSYILVIEKSWSEIKGIEKFLHPMILRGSHDGIVVGFTTTYAISAYHH